MNEGENPGKGYLGLDVVDRIPTLEEVFKVPRLCWKEKILMLWGSGLIALGTSIWKWRVSARSFSSN